MTNEEAGDEPRLRVRRIADVVCAYVGHNQVPASDVPTMIRNVAAAIDGLKNGHIAETPALEPAVPINKSVKNEYIICLECGERFKTLKRHLRSSHDLSPEAYKKKWGLPADYPMVAPAYADQRSHFAKQIGLGKSDKGSNSRR